MAFKIQYKLSIIVAREGQPENKIIFLDMSIKYSCPIANRIKGKMGLAVRKFRPIFLTANLMLMLFGCFAPHFDHGQ